VGVRVATVAALLALLNAGAGSAASPSLSWAAPQIQVVTSAGVMSPSNPAIFRPDDALTAQDLENLAFALKQALAAGAAPATATTTATTTTTPAAPAVVANGTQSVTMVRLDARLVQALGLTKAAQEFAAGARAAGLQAPSRFGTEVVARLLGLRTNHPASQDSLELLPGDPATRAEAAYSAARALALTSWQLSQVQNLAATFALPGLSDWQKLILNTAVARIGMPYIWGGTSDGPETDFGVPARGGYDCSGFVWRVYKLTPYANEGTLASSLRGRTTYEMSGEVPRAQRITLAQLQPADVIFFGTNGPTSKPAQVGHMGIYLGNGWFIHSSDYGVALAPLTGWYGSHFAWGRRPLREAGLAS
jgi:cell wall-associated NlpC family hydrolase